MNSEQETKYAELLEQARWKMTHQALKLQTAFGPTDAIGLLVGAAVGLALEYIGQEKAAEFFAGVSQEILDGIDTSTH